MKNRHALIFFLAATLLSMTFLTVHVPFVGAIVWSPENQLTTDPLQDLGPAIMQAGDGNIWVVWSSNRISPSNYELFYTTSSNYGLNWSNYIRLTEDPIFNESHDTGPSIMQASNGIIWVVWSSDRTGDNELFYKISPVNGAWWFDDTQLTTNDSARDEAPSIAQAMDGTIWVVWHSNRTGNYELFYKTYDGAFWSSYTQLTTHPDLDKYPSIMQASNGTIWVVWSSYRTGDHELFFKTFNGTAWSSDTQLTYDSASDEAPSIAQARDGTIWVVWQSSDIPDLYYKFYDGASWSSDEQLTTDNDKDGAPSIAQIDDKKIWVVWATDRDENWDIYYKTSSEILTHDVAVTSVTPSSTTVKQGKTVSINVTAENQGDYPETFDVSCYANAATIGTQTTTLANGTSTTLTFPWNTTGVDQGDYTISAEASAVPGEILTSDNVYTDDTVTVTIIHDVAVTSVTPSSTTVKQGEPVSINVTAENQGDYPETFDVSCYANAATIGTQTTTLANGTSTTLTFPWDTIGVDEGDYTISAEASVVPDETDTADNVYTDGAVTVTTAGDVNGDGIVDMDDLALVEEAYGKAEGEPGYDPDADLNCDGVIDIYDLALVGKNYGKTVDS